jgi:2-methylisocitrate lyase-like PEP mutase family enzyme
MSSQVAAFRKLHTHAMPLRLPNAWDAGSARLFENEGAQAIATTSAGLCWSLGYADGRAAPLGEIIEAAARMVRVLNVPFTFDFEHGYANEPSKVADNVLRLAHLGVDGINIEDGRDDASVLARKVEAIRNALCKANLDLFINTRCDVFLAHLAEETHLLGESIRRGQLYAKAGADGFFLPGVSQPEHISAVAGGVPLPLNVMSVPELPNAMELAKLGVRRLSAGSAIAQVLWLKAQTLAQEFLKSGRSEPLLDGAMPYPQLQELFAQK